MPFLPDALVSQGYGAFGFNPWIWPEKLADGGDIIIRREARAAWSDAFSKAYLQQLGSIRGFVATPVAPDIYYSFNFDTGALGGPYPAGGAIWPELPVAPPSTIGFTITDPVTGVTRPLESSDINKPVVTASGEGAPPVALPAITASDDDLRGASTGFLEPAPAVIPTAANTTQSLAPAATTVTSSSDGPPWWVFAGVGLALIVAMRK